MSTLRIKLSSVSVDDQEKALHFYTGVLGFKRKFDIPMGEARWLTVVSAQGPEDMELVLEPISFAPAKVYQQALHSAGIPANAFQVDVLDAEYSRLVELGVVFTKTPTPAGPVSQAVLDDTCGNLIQLYQVIG